LSFGVSGLDHTVHPVVFVARYTAVGAGFGEHIAFAIITPAGHVAQRVGGGGFVIAVVMDSDQMSINHD
jgi:hypothetical protein